MPSPVFTLKNDKNVPSHSSKCARYIFTSSPRLQTAPGASSPLCPLALSDLLKPRKFTQKGLLLKSAWKVQQQNLKNPHVVPLEEVRLSFPASRSNETKKNVRDLARTWPRATSALLCRAEWLSPARSGPFTFIFVSFPKKLEHVLE